MASQVNKINMDIWKEHVDGLLAWLWASVGAGGGGGGSGGLITPWTADVTPALSPFTPSAAQVFVSVNTATGAVTVRTPAAPFDGQIFYMKARVASATPITVSALGVGITVEDPSNGGTYGATGSIQSVAGASVGFKFRASDKLWIAFSGM